jgi:DNA-binding NarL/FixJ family response regulator
MDVVLLDETEVARPPSATSVDGRLTPREAEVLDLLSHGLSNAQIAHTLDSGERTVQKHLEHVYRKLGVDSRTAAMAWAVARRPAPD